MSFASIPAVDGYGLVGAFAPHATVEDRVRGPRDTAQARVDEARAAIREATAHVNPNLLPYIRLRSLSPTTDLPPHERLGNAESTVDAVALVSAVLDQALTFADRVLPRFHSDKVKVESRPSLATVDVSSLDRVESKWVARTSQHVNTARPGSASWEEFITGLKNAHCQKEMAYTPDIIGAHKVCDWDIPNNVAGWKDVTCDIYEMVQKVSFPHSHNRAYPLLVVTALSAEYPHFVVVKIPINLSAAPGALYVTGKNTKDDTLATDLRKKMTVGEYVSVERVRLEEALPGYEKSEVSTTEPMVHWEMAATYNSKAIGKDRNTVSKDVGLFIDWVGKNRELKASVDQTIMNTYKHTGPVV